MDNMNNENIVIFDYDGYTFYISKNNYHNEDYDILGCYVDNMGYIQTIKRDSIFGKVIPLKFPSLFVDKEKTK
jgi:hypothetical protein